MPQQNGVNVSKLLAVFNPIFGLRQNGGSVKQLCSMMLLQINIFIPCYFHSAAPLVKIKQSLTKLKQETVQMDIRIGVVEHTLLQSQLKEKSNMTRDMHATIIPESAMGSY